MGPFLDAVFRTENIALILAVGGCVACFWFHLGARKEDREERTKRDTQAAAERAALYELIRQNTAAMHELRNTLSALSGKVL